ncbi:MAG TPA: hypothetical protein VHC39_19730 [Rhizomicrobium sp.]|nr:hypothetical protein [Rhizomicrobium sp.]
MAARRIASAILLLGYAAMLAMNAPGQLSYDSVSQLADGRAGFYNSWHPPVMAWLLGAFDSLVPGTLLFLIFQSLLLLGALLTLLWQRPRGWPSLVLAAAIVLTPQWLLYQGEIWKDILFSDAAIAGFAALAVYARTQGRAALALAVLLLVLAASTRQNGVALLPVAAITLGLIARRQGKTAWRPAILSLLAMLALTAALHFALAPRTDGGEGASAELRLGRSYDLAGALARKPDLVLPLEADPALDHVLRTRARALYTPLRNDPMAADPAVSLALANAPDGVIAAAWRSLLLHHPLLYLQTRWADFLAVLTAPDPLVCHLAPVGVSGPPQLLGRLGLKGGVRPQDQALAHYTMTFGGTPVLSHPVWAALAILLLVLLIRRDEPGDLAMAGLLAGTLLFTLTFAIISIACDYRYLVFLDLSVMAAALYFVKKA